ncbi:hypothetical protein JCM21900_004374 [Sporobolomyces salmonicolor]
MAATLHQPLTAGKDKDVDVLSSSSTGCGSAGAVSLPNAHTTPARTTFRHGYRFHFSLLEPVPNEDLLQVFGRAAYLCSGASEQVSYPSWTDRFSPSANIFAARHLSQILLADALFLLAVTLYNLFGMEIRSFGEVVKYYGILVYH